MQRYSSLFVCFLIGNLETVFVFILVNMKNNNCHFLSYLFASHNQQHKKQRQKRVSEGQGTDLSLISQHRNQTITVRHIHSVSKNLWKMLFASIWVSMNAFHLFAQSGRGTEYLD